MIDVFHVERRVLAFDHSVKFVERNSGLFHSSYQSWSSSFTAIGWAKVCTTPRLENTARPDGEDLWPRAWAARIMATEESCTPSARRWGQRGMQSSWTGIAASWSGRTALREKPPNKGSGMNRKNSTTTKNAAAPHPIRDPAKSRYFRTGAGLVAAADLLAAAEAAAPPPARRSRHRSDWPAGCVRRRRASPDRHGRGACG